MIINIGFVCFCLTGWTGRQCETSKSIITLHISLNIEFICKEKIFVNKSISLDQIPSTKLICFRPLQVLTSAHQTPVKTTRPALIDT